MNVKICGITTITDAQFAEKNGADFIGFVFAPSKRYVTTEQAADISKSLEGHVKKVGVFVNESIENMIHIAKNVPLDMIQLHGNESAKTAENLPVPVIKAFSIEKADPKTIRDYPCDYLLIDSPGTTHEGGSGVAFDWDQLSNIEFDRSKFILAGGLKPDNVNRAIQAVGPIGVDVSSGVETDGRKDQNKIKQFIHEAKSNRKVETK